MTFMEFPLYKQASGDWSLFFTKEGHRIADNMTPDTSETLLKCFDIIKVLKDDQRSLVALIDYNHLKYIYKIPREKNRRKWIQFTTLYRNSEVKKNFLILIKLKQFGISSNDPLIFGEKRSNGRVVDSFIIYSYLEGSSITPDNHQQLIEEIKIIHSNGYLHGDFHSRNFLLTNERISFLDTALKTNYFGDIGRCYEMLYFLRNNRTDNKLRDIQRRYLSAEFSRLAIFLASVSYTWFELWRKIKKKIRLVLKERFS